MIQNDQIDDGFREILSNLLTINPYFRWTASECLAHPIFNDIRNPSFESIPGKKIKLDVDQDDAFNYEEGVSEKFTREHLIFNLITEVDTIHSCR